ncbi:MAG: AMP-binding protein [Planctomycetota bacterium]
MSTVLWQPSPEQVERAAATTFRRFVNDRYGLDLRDWEALYRWSVTERAHFWEAVWRFSDVRAQRGWDHVLRDGERFPGSRWFEGARLNYAENLLRRRDEAEAIVFRSEAGAERRLSHGELYRQVARLARALTADGVRPGDRVVGFMPNIPETVVAMLAAASLGAVWSSCSPDFGLGGVIDRFGQIEPRVVFATDGSVYAGRRDDLLPRVRGILEQLPSVERTVVVPYVSTRPDLSGLRGGVHWDEYLGEERPGEIPLAQLPFVHPLFIMYSSGTTGLPKSIVHSAGGTLLQHLKEHRLHSDFGPGDRVFYFTTTGWMMWNWLVSALASEATLVLYDGSPMAPAPVLWDLAAAERVTGSATISRPRAASWPRPALRAQRRRAPGSSASLSLAKPRAPPDVPPVPRSAPGPIPLPLVLRGHLRAFNPRGASSGALKQAPAPSVPPSLLERFACRAGSAQLQGEHPAPQRHGGVPSRLGCRHERRALREQLGLRDQERQHHQQCADGGGRRCGPESPARL